MPKNPNSHPRKYEYKVYPRLNEKKEFIISHMRKEWVDSERSVRKEDIIRAIKAGGIIAGKGILILLAIAGTVTIAAVAPNIFAAFGKMGKRNKYKTYIGEKNLKKELRDLKKKKYIEITRDADNDLKVDITKHGETVALQQAVEKFKIAKQNVWDGIWRIVIFDIPDTHKSAREGFRRKLKSMGFYPLQKSVFIFPYPCAPDIEFLIHIYNTPNFVHMIETSKITNDDELREYFSL